MFVYTVKLLVDNDEKGHFIDYLYKTHLPDVVNTGCFLDSTLEADTKTDEIIARYRCVSQEIFDKYIAEHAEEMRNDVLKNFPKAILKAERNFCKVIHQE